MCKPGLLNGYLNHYGNTTIKAIGTVSRTATLVSGIEKTLAPAGRELLDGAGVPH